MNKNREAYYKQAELEEKALAGTNPKKGYDKEKKSFNRPEKKRLCLTFNNVGEGINFNYQSKTKGDFDTSSAMAMLSECPFNILSIPVKVQASLVGKNGNFLVDVGYISRYDVKLDGESISVNIKEQYVDTFEALGGNLKLNIKTLVDRDLYPTKFIEWEIVKK